MAKSFIHYDTKNNIQYASVYTPSRKNGKKDNSPMYLGRVLDKDNGIYKSRQRGVFKYTLEGGFQECTDQEAASVETVHEEKLILDFGDAFLCDSLVRSSEYNEVFTSFLDNKKDADTLMSLAFYRVLSHEANCYAADWYQGSYARIMYPDAELSSQRISEFLEKIGDEALQRKFFRNYLSVLTNGKCKNGILIDSTGLPNQIDFPLTALNNHAGVVNNEVRLIMITDKATGMPMYFRYNAGNIVDVATLSTTIKELQLMNVNADLAIVDSGYFSEENIKMLYSEKIAFLTRMGSNRKLYKQLVEDNADDLTKSKYIVIYSDRILHVKKVETDLFGNKGYAYVIIDENKRRDESEKYIKAAVEDGVTADEMDKELKKKGIFILVSSEDIDTADIVPMYYTRQQIEQVFDISKTSVDLLPLRVHSEKTFRGHLFIVFLATLIRIIISNKLTDWNFNTNASLIAMRNLKCKVFDNHILVKEPTKKMKNIAKLAGITLPSILKRGKKNLGN